jgi:hypothetical protein
MLPSGSRSHSERRPQGWVVGGVRIRVPEPGSFSCRASTSSTSNSIVKLPLPAPSIEPGSIASMPAQEATSRGCRTSQACQEAD